MPVRVKDYGHCISFGANEATSQYDFLAFILCPHLLETAIIQNFFSFSVSVFSKVHPNNCLEPLK